MEVAILPVSGGRFPQQLAAIREICRVGEMPPLILCSSGGSVSTYLAMCARWDPLSIERVAHSVSDKHIISSWFPNFFNFVPSYFAGIFLGSIYKTSTETLTLFKTYLTTEDIKDREIWVGCTNDNTSASGLFCNKSKEESIIQGYNFNTSLLKSEPLIYLDGDVEQICKSVVASSTIPVIFKPQYINGKKYIDGGTKFASPAFALNEELRILGVKHGGIHVLYINGYDVEEDMKPREQKSMFRQGVDVTEHAIRSFIIQDRKLAYDLINDQGWASSMGPERCCHEIMESGIENRTYCACFPISKFEDVYKLRKNALSSLIEIYPKGSIEILEVDDFSGDDVVRVMKNALDVLHCRIWWHGNKNLLEGVVEGIIEMTSHYSVLAVRGMDKCGKKW